MAINKELLQLVVKAQGIEKTKSQLKDMDSATGGSTKSFVGMATAIAGATAAMYGLGKAIQVGKEFEQSMAKVQAISSATEKEFIALSKNARALGASTAFTASEVAGLQTKFAKLGFTATEINEVTKGTLELAGATGTDLATAATVAGSSLRGFGLDVGETGRVTNLMAASFSASALDMQKFSDSMTYVAPVAKMAGFSIEGTTAMMGQLANAGIDGSMAGTALRRIFLELSNESSKLSQRLGGPIKNVNELVPALKKLNKEGVSTAEMKDLVGQRAISAFSVLMEGADTITDLTNKFASEDGLTAATDQYNTMMDTLQGDMDKMNSAFANLGITIFEMADGPLRSVTQGITSFISGLDEEALKSYGTGLGLVGIGYGIVQRQAIAATLATKGFKVAMASTGIGLAVVLLGGLAGKLIELTGYFDDATDAIDDFDAGLGKIGKSVEIGETLEELEGEIGETMAGLDDVLGTTSGEGDFGDEKLEARLKRQLLGARNALNDHNAELKNIGKDHRMVALEEEESDMMDAMQVLVDRDGLKNEKKLEVEAEFKDRKTKLQEKINKEEQLTQLKHHSQLLGGTASFLKNFAGGEVAAARLQQSKALIDAYSAASKAYTKYGGWPTGIVPAATSLAYGLGNVAQIEKSIGGMKYAQHGMDEVVSRPTLLMAGENNQAESVKIQPLEDSVDAGGGGGQTFSINIQGNVMSDQFVEEELSDKIATAVIRGVDFGLN